ncbi:MAG TPA: hypothetical protein PLQ13_01010 [Candidatus Krumholzibacteria bacterium]|nr:hypothetical protein [Candidatus Krumholzibacteria bacterium]
MRERRVLPGIPALMVALSVWGTAQAAAFTLPLPDGWRSETIPFPLPFAPGLPYEGVEELRFAPGMFTAGADDFWTYAFCWWVPEDTPLDSKLLERDLEAYFAGLTRTVEDAEHFTAEDPRYAVQLEPKRTRAGEPRAWSGSLDVFDAFVTHAPLALNVQVEVESCPDEGMVGVLFLVSPQPAGHAVWKSLAQLRAGFRCRG